MTREELLAALDKLQHVIKPQLVDKYQARHNLDLRIAELENEQALLVRCLRDGIEDLIKEGLPDVKP